MAKGFIGASGYNAYLGTIKMRAGYIGATRVYSAGGNIVTYCVDSGVTYQEEVDEGASCLSPKTFTPSKSGWEFVGWRSDAVANGSVLSSKVMDDGIVTLYAVFRKAVTVTYYNNSTTASSTSGYRYYNNSNVANPNFTLTQAASSGWTARGWSTSNSGNAGIAYANVATFTRDSNVTLYGLYQQSITVTYYNNSTTASSTTGTRYWAPAGYINPSFTLTQSSKSGWTARGWSTSTAGNGGISYNNGATFTRDSNITLYGMYQQTITVTYYNNSTTATTTSGTRYYNSNGNVINPSFTLTQASKGSWTARGWSTSTAGNGSIAYSNATAFTRDSNVTLYGMYYRSITLTYYNGSTTAASTSGMRYYNSGSDLGVIPAFSLTPTSLSGWTFRGWATSSAATAGIAYSNISHTGIADSTTIYAAYSQTITLSYNGNGSTSGSTAAQTGTRYWNTGNVSNPSFTLSANGFTKSGYDFSKWALGSASGTQYAAGASVTLSANTTMYAIWTYVGTPFYIVNNYTIQGNYQESVKWSINQATNVSSITGWTSGVYGATIFGHGNENNNRFMWINSSEIATNGNHTIRIKANGASGGAWITINGTEQEMIYGKEATWDISNRTSIVIYGRANGWTSSNGPYIQFIEIYLY